MFVPGHRQRMLDKALLLTHVDALILDIEDGVPQQEKENARQSIGGALSGAADRRKRPACYARVSSIAPANIGADLAAIVQPGLDGLVLPKAETPEQVRVVEKILAELESRAGFAAGKIAFLIAIESPRGLRNAGAIAAASPRVSGLMFGAEDFGKELGLPLRREGEARDLLFARSAIVCAAAEANVQAIDGVWPDLRDDEGLKRYALQSRRLGFTGMSLIHPSQIESINQTFAPTEDELLYCRQVIEAYEAAVTRGDGAIAFGGQLIDLPIVDRARRTLAFAAKLQAPA